MKHTKETQRKGTKAVNPRGCEVKRCVQCLVDIVYPDNINPSNYRKYKYICRTCSNKIKYQQEKIRRQNKKVGSSQHIADMLDNTRSGAKRRGIEFSLTKKDIKITEFCPILNIKYELNKKNVTWGTEKGQNNWCNSPSIDRIDNNKGYIKDNIIIVSLMANSIKNQATPDQIQKVATFYKKLYKERGIAYG